MSAISQIVLADAQATPANHTFAPANPQVGTSPAQWINRETSVVIGDRRITLLVAEKALKYVITARIYDPVVKVNSTTQASEVAYRNIATLEYNVDKLSTLEDRKNLRKFSKLLIDHVHVVQAVEGLEITW